MGASFRKTTQILDLAGCDLLTISPELLAKLEATRGEVPARLTPESARRSDARRVELDEAGFRTTQRMRDGGFRETFEEAVTALYG